MKDVPRGMREGAAGVAARSDYNGLTFPLVIHAMFLRTAVSRVPARLLIAAALAVLAVVGYCAITRAAPMPEVRFVNLQGRTITTQDLRGKVVMVNFWATSCDTCVQEMPAMIDTYNRYKARGLQFIAVAMSYDRPDYVVNFAKTRALPFDVALDVKGELAKAFGDVQLTPTTFVIDRQGNIVKRYVGEPAFSSLHRLLDKELGA